MKEKDKKTLEYIREKEKQGKVSFMTFAGLASCQLKDFFKQPADGVLYDLNRDKLTTLTIMPELRWINDYAVAVVIEYLMSDKYQAEVAKQLFIDCFDLPDKDEGAKLKMRFNHYEVYLDFCDKLDKRGE